MNGVLKKIRVALRMTQTDLATAIGISRGLWSVHEGKDEREDHDAPPHIVRELIKQARRRGVPLTYEHVYDGAPLPQMVLVPLDSLPPELRPGRKRRPVPPPKKPRTGRPVIADRS